MRSRHRHQRWAGRARALSLATTFDLASPPGARFRQFSIIQGDSGALAQSGPRGQVDDQRLLGASDQTDADWIMFGQDYRNQRFSSLTGIDRTTVERLQPAWIYQTGTVGSHQTEPLVVDGVMYFTTPTCDVIAVDASTGDEVWRYRHRYTSPRAGASNRGAAVAYGKVYEATDDHRVIALDQNTGAVVFDKLVPGFEPSPSLGQPGLPLPTKIDFAFRAPPLIYHGNVIVSAAFFSGSPSVDDAYVQEKLQAGEDVGLAVIQDSLGRRGFVAALDAETGVERWRFYTTREDGWEGNYVATAPDGTPLNRDIDSEKATGRAVQERVGHRRVHRPLHPGGGHGQRLAVHRHRQSVRCSGSAGTSRG